MWKLKIDVFFLVLVMVSSILIYCTITKGHNWGGDFAAYIMQAQSITEGVPSRFVEDNRFIVQESTTTMGPIAYPWGFPVMLAPLFALFGLNIVALKAVGVLCLVLLLFLLRVGFRKYHSRFWLLCLVCLFSLNPFLLTFTNNVLSDIPFLLFSTLSVLLIGRVVVDDRRLTNSRIYDHILLGAAISGAIFIRTNGLLILVILVITQLVSVAKKRRELKGQCATGPSGRFFDYRFYVSLVPYVIILCAVLVWETVLPRGGFSHVSALKGISSSHIIHNLRYYFNLPADFLNAGPYFSARFWYFASIPFAVAGVILRYRYDYHIVLYVLLTFLLYVLWPATQGLRFLFPLIPFYCSFVITSLESLETGATDRETRLRKIVCILPVIYLLSCLGMSSLDNASYNLRKDREVHFGAFSTPSQSMFSFVQQNTALEDTIIYFEPRVMRMMTNRKSLRIDKVGLLSRGDYLCLHRKHNIYQVSHAEILQLSEQGNALLIYENSLYMVYRLDWEQ